jgi:hypothetical protein
MPRRNDIAKILIIGPFLVYGLVFESQSRRESLRPRRSLAVQCAPDLDKSRERFFANPGAKRWKEYTSAKQIPPLSGSNGEEMIVVKTSSAGLHYVHTESHGEDSAHYQQSCYDQVGTLRSMHYEMRTAWGWGYDEIRRFDDSGKLTQRSSYFFDTSNNERVNRPAQADDVPDFLKPEIYQTFGSLPIIGVFEHRS